jgi:hypothetical protein
MEEDNRAISHTAEVEISKVRLKLRLKRYINIEGATNRRMYEVIKRSKNAKTPECYLLARSQTNDAMVSSTLCSISVGRGMSISIDRYTAMMLAIVNRRW